MEVFLGTILPWPISYAPQGWAFCNGQTLSTNQNQALYSLIGPTYGGDQSAFKLPNLCGKFPLGSSFMGNPLEPYIQAQLGTTGGQKDLYLQSNQIPSHVHSISNVVTVGNNGAVSVGSTIAIPVNTDAYDGNKATNVPSSTATLGVGKAGSFTTNIYTSSAPTAGASLAPFTIQNTMNIPAPTVTSTCAPQQPAQSLKVPTVPPYLTINYIIALEGLYPMRP